jgi:hypothetical protein
MSHARTCTPTSTPAGSSYASTTSHNPNLRRSNPGTYLDGSNPKETNNVIILSYNFVNDNSQCRYSDAHFAACGIVDCSV